MSKQRSKYLLRGDKCLPRQTLHPKGACYLKKHIDDVMGTFSRGSTSAEGNGLLATTSDFQCVSLACPSHHLSFPFMN